MEITMKCGSCGQILYTGTYLGEIYVSFCPACAKRIVEQACQDSDHVYIELQKEAK